MMRRSSMAIVFAVAAHATIASAQAQPEVWSVVCNTLKVGTTAEMYANESRWARAMEADKATAPGIAAMSVSGVPQICWLSNVQTMENYGKTMQAAAKIAPRFEAATKAYANDVRFYIGLSRPDIKTAAPVNLGTMRLLSWITVRVRPGQDEAFITGMKAYAAAQKRAGVNNDGWGVIEVAQGETGTVYWVMIPIDAFADMDKMRAADPKVMAAMTPDDGKVFATFFGTAIGSMSSQLFMLDPVLSSMPADARKQFGDFWKLPAAAAAKK